MISLQERSLVGSSLAKLVVPGCFCRDDRACPKTKCTQYNDNAKESKSQINGKVIENDIVHKLHLFTLTRFSWGMRFKTDAQKMKEEALMEKLSLKELIRFRDNLKN